MSLHKNDWLEENLEDWIEAVISDSLGPDWQPRDGARHLMRHLRDGPYRVVPVRAQVSYITWENPDGPQAA